MISGVPFSSAAGASRKACMIEIVEREGTGARIKVVGVGGGGGNAVNHMVRAGLTGVEFLAMNTDAQALSTSLAPRRFQLGCQLTKGLGAGGDPEVGREAALEDRERIAELLAGADMVFVTAGMGGGTGTGAGPVVCEVARELGALTVAVVTTPFAFEGRRRRRQAEEGLEALIANADTLISIPNQRLLAMGTERTLMLEAFGMADDVLFQAVKGISDLVNQPGVINVDFADVRTIMANQGRALMGVGVGSGQHRAVDAAQRAISSPLLDDLSISGATCVLLNFTGGPSLSLYEVNEAAQMVAEETAEDENVIFGLVVDETMGDEVRVTVVATGFQEARQRRTPLSRNEARAAKVVNANPAAWAHRSTSWRPPEFRVIAPQQVQHEGTHAPPPARPAKPATSGRDASGAPAVVRAIASPDWGIAIFHEGVDAFLVDVRHDIARPISQVDAVRLLRRATCLVPLVEASIDGIRRKLVHHRGRYDLLDAVVTLLSQDTPEVLRKAALEQALTATDRAAWEWVENVLLSTPAPPGLRFSEVPSVRPLSRLAEVQRLQPRVRELADAWNTTMEGIPSSAVDGMRLEAIERGWFASAARRETIVGDDSSPVPLRRWVEMAMGSVAESGSSGPHRRDGGQPRGTGGDDDS